MVFAEVKRFAMSSQSRHFWRYMGHMLHIMKVSLFPAFALTCTTEAFQVRHKYFDDDVTVRKIFAGGNFFCSK